MRENLQYKKLFYYCSQLKKEAFSIYEEMESGTFKYLTFAFGNMIYDDIKNKLR